MFELAWAYYHGKAVTRDRRAAGSWYVKAAERGNVAAMVNVAMMLLSEDPRGAARWFGEAAECGDRAAMKHLAQLYEKGIGVEKDPAKAQIWRQKACLAGGIRHHRSFSQRIAPLSGDGDR